MTELETMWHFGQEKLEYWRWSSLYLCQPCKRALWDFVRGRRREQPGIQLRMLSDADAPLRVLSDAELSPVDVEDLQTLASWRRRPRQPLKESTEALARSRTSA